MFKILVEKNLLIFLIVSGSDFSAISLRGSITFALRASTSLESNFADLAAYFLQNSLVEIIYSYIKLRKNPSICFNKKKN